MGSSRQGRTRHPGRNLLPLREREFGQPKSPRSDKKKEDKDTEESDDEDKVRQISMFFFHFIVTINKYLIIFIYP